MSSTKKQIRQQFRDSVFERDKHKCRICGCYNQKLDAHHITNRNDMPNGGYVPENGISLCPICHLKAENGEISSEELYKMINSNYERARRISTTSPME